MVLQKILNKRKMLHWNSFLKGVPKINKSLFYLYNMNSWFIFMKTVEHNLSWPFCLVCQLHFGKINLITLPVGAEIWAVGVDVHGVLWCRLRLSAGQPLAVHVFPAMVLYLDKFQEDAVHGAGIQAWDTNLERKIIINHKISNNNNQKQLSKW